MAFLDIVESFIPNAGVILNQLGSFIPDINIASLRSINGVIPNVLIQEVHTDEIELTQHPVQEGATITDHKFKKPKILKMSVLFDGFTQGIYQLLLEMQESNELLVVVTGRRVYENMQIKSLIVVTNKDTNFILKIDIELVEIIIVSVSVTESNSVASVDKQAMPTKTSKTQKIGAKKVQQVKDAGKSEQVNKSALKVLFG